MNKIILDGIMRELNHFRFRRSSASYQYLIEAIYLVIVDRSSIKNFYQNIYVPIAKKFNTRPENVQWSLSKLINLMYLNTSDEVISNYFCFYMEEKPTLKFFIITIAQNVNDSLVISC